MDNQKGKELKKEVKETLKELKQEAKEEVKQVKNAASNLTDVEKMNRNPWRLSTYVLGFVVIVLIVLFFLDNSSAGMSGEEAGKNLASYLDARVGGGVEFISSEALGDSLYQVVVSYQGQDIPVYVTKDGNYFVQGAIPMNETIEPAQGEEETPQEIPQSAKPKVELFIWSYCPYGVQAQGPLAEVAKLLGKSADFEAVPYYDGHGAYETQQNKIQLCIQQVAKDKYWSYAEGFVKDIYSKCGASRDIECDKNESIKLMKSLAIDSTKVMSCVNASGDSLFAEAASKAQKAGVTGSPTLVINGVKANVARNSEAYKAAVCSAFNSAPDACSTTLDSSQTAASGNC
ncbi:MAG: hypothetical protein ACP5OG_01460 [Candidatus Nanoarchaeia archaeon]